MAKNHLGIDVALMPPDIDEREAGTRSDGSPESHTSVIALAKLEYLLQKIPEPNTIVMCCDTIVYNDGKILEKPSDMEECVKMVRTWGKKDNRISVYTAIAVGRTEPRNIQSSVERADIVMTRDLTEEEIPQYIETSGALQSSGAVIVESLVEMNAAVVEGDQTVIEGLPITATKKFLELLK